MCKNSAECYCDHFKNEPVTLEGLVEALEADPPMLRVLKREDRACILKTNVMPAEKGGPAC